jgi:hypothetical protein
MRTPDAVTLLVGMALLAAGSLIRAADTRAGGERPAKMNEPMETKMMKPGMKVGDVKKAAAKKERELKPMLEKESAAPPKQ